MKEIFEHYIDNTFDGRTQSLGRFKEMEINYKKYFPVEKSFKVLDVGIGRGEMLSCMKRWGFQNYHGIDISPSTVQFCQSLDLSCSLVDDSLQYLLANKNTYAVITVFDVLEHITKDQVVAFVNALQQALTEDGVLLIQVPNLQAPEGYLHRYNDITHEIGFVEHSLAQVLLAAGFLDFKFFGLNSFVRGPLIDIPRTVLREIHWAWVRCRRMIDGNLNPKILAPVLCVAAYKHKRE